MINLLDDKSDIPQKVKNITLNPDTPTELKQRYSNTLASVYFINTGLSIKTTNSKGQLVPYKATQNDINDRNQKLKMIAIIHNSTTTIRREILEWISLLILSIIIGTIIRIK